MVDMAHDENSQRGVVEVGDSQPPLDLDEVAYTGPSCFQRYTDSVLLDYIDRFVTIFVGDVLRYNHVGGRMSQRNLYAVSPMPP
ncbi:hypothetical protein KEM55_003248 [Ascosphaera atra]|nr:hypothetical protein KEM55_003248 [Ascosphaera atra]